MRQVDCLTCGCRGRKCKWGRRVLGKKLLMSAGDKGSQDCAAGVVSWAGSNRHANYIYSIYIIEPISNAYFG